MSTYTTGRLLNRQRQLGEQGRLRFGQMVTGTRKNGSTYTRPSSTLTWIVTSYSQEHVQTAAALWGGQVERWKPQGHGAEQWRVITEANEIPAILPPGNPLFQAYELWSGGGCQRRCNGEIEELSGSQCICRAQFGDAYHEQKQGTVCDDKTRLKVILPDMPGIGSWRMETGSFYAADEIAGFVDLVRATVGDQVLVPIKLTLIQDTVTRDGETKQFVRPKVDLRGRTAGELLSGAPSLAPLGSGAATPAVAANGRAAIEAPRTDYAELIRAAVTREQVVKIWEQARQDPAADGKQVEAAAKARVAELNKDAQSAPAETPAAPPADEQSAPAQEGTPAASDAEMLWQAIVARWPRGMTELTKTFAKDMRVQHQAASETELAAFLKALEAGKYDDKPQAATSGAKDEVPF